MQSTRTADIDNIPRLSVLNPKVRRCRPHNLERRGAVKIDDSMPLLVRHLVDYAVPCVARIVNNDVDLAVTEVCGGFYEFGYVGIVKDVAGDGDGGAARFVDLVNDFLCFLC